MMNAKEWEAAAQQDASRAVYPAPDYDESGAQAAARVLELIPPNPSGTLLEVGCGDGRITQYLWRDFGLVIACDISPTMLDQMQSRVLRAGADIDRVVPVLTDGLGGFGDLFQEIPGLRFDAVCSECVLMHHPSKVVYVLMALLRSIVDEATPFALQLPVYDVAREPESFIDVGTWTVDGLLALCSATGWIADRLVSNPGEFSYDALPGPNHREYHLLRAG